MHHRTQEREHQKDSGGLPLSPHRKTKSRTFIGLQNQGPILRISRLQFKPNDCHAQKLELQDLAFTKTSTLEVEIEQDNAYLKSSIKYFQRENQRLLKLISQKDKKIVTVKDQLTGLLVDQNRTLMTQNRSLEKTLISRSRQKIRKTEFRPSPRQQKTKSADKGSEYLHSLQRIKTKLDDLNFHRIQKIVERGSSRVKNL